MKRFIALLITVIAFALVAQNSFAAGDSTCQTIYGGGQVCQEQVKFTINKLVQKPGKGGEFVENLTINDPKYSPDQNINFKIVIQNTGDTEIKNLNVVDRFPQLLTFVAGVGATNVGGSQVNFTIGSLAKGAKAEYIITAKSATESNFANTVTCVTNAISATANDGTSANDNSQVCIEKKVLGSTPEVMEKPFVKNIPSTGPEMGLIALSIPTGLLGFYLRKRA